MPLIATRVGGIPEVLAGAHERLVPAGDPAALAAALRLALDDPGRMRDEAVLRQQRVRENFSLTRMASRIEHIYQTALQKRYSSADPTRRHSGASG
jgi:glycosyltransferase involved in cell wall biosynthesis